MLGDALPTIYDVTISILTVTSNLKTDKMADCVNSYVTSLVDWCTKAFGAENVLCRKQQRKKYKQSSVIITIMFMLNTRVPNQRKSAWCL